MTGGGVVDLTPTGEDAPSPAAMCPECPIADDIERREQDARRAAWAGILVSVLGVLTWNTWGFLVCGIAALAFGLYARGLVPTQAWADFAAGGMLLGVLGLRLSGVL